MAFLDWSVRKVDLKELWTLKWHKTYMTDGPWTRAGGVTADQWPEWMRRIEGLLIRQRQERTMRIRRSSPDPTPDFGSMMRIEDFDDDPRAIRNRNLNRSARLRGLSR